MFCKRYIIGLAIAASFIATGCGQAEKSVSTSVKPPAKPAAVELWRIEAPHATTESNIMIRGHVEPKNASVTLDDIPATVVNGEFSGVVSLHKGKNEIEVYGYAKGSHNTYEHVSITRTKKAHTPKPQPKLKQQPTPKPKPQTIKRCLIDAGFTTEVDPDLPTMITVNGDDGLAVAFLEQQATAKDARESQAMLDDMEADTKAQAEEDGWSPDGAEDIPNENVGRYLITYLYPEDGEQDAIHTCVSNFTKDN